MIVALVSKTCREHREERLLGTSVKENLLVNLAGQFLNKVPIIFHKVFLGHMGGDFVTFVHKLISFRRVLVYEKC